ncbi:integral membrane protein 2B-like [Tubulanus polymorphus]|uniref:integral membrane protein 2B-like n=1 Tax=Tubulanus polymorphus TaxID=672921 RepID=UPI003DA4B450
MTIYKTPVTEKKPEEDGKLPPVVIPVAAATESESTDEAHDNFVNVSVRRYERRPQRTTNVCICLAALIVLIMGIVGGIYLYRHLTHKTYRAICDLRYIDDMMVGDEPHAGFLREHVEIDESQKALSRIEVPKFDECSSAVILHAFSVNLTAIVDNDNRRCFVLPLDRKHVIPPRDFWDMLVKLRTGYYVPSSRVIREHYRIIKPPIRNKAVLGPYIALDCEFYDTYRLKKINYGRVRIGKHHHHKHSSHRHRRDAEQQSDKESTISFGEYAGRGPLTKLVVHLK